jgi:hypothetical protein
MLAILNLQKQFLFLTGLLSNGQFELKEQEAMAGKLFSKNLLEFKIR